jgi:hypothetical protein
MTNCQLVQLIAEGAIEQPLRFVHGQSGKLPVVAQLNSPKADFEFARQSTNSSRAELYG